MTFKEPSMSSLNNWSIGSGCVSDDEGENIHIDNGTGGIEIGNGCLNQRN